MVDVAKKGAAVSVVANPVSSSDVPVSPLTEENGGDSSATDAQKEDYYGFYKDIEEQQN